MHLLTGLDEVVLVEDVCLMHEAAHWGRTDALARLLGASNIRGMRRTSRTPGSPSPGIRTIARRATSEVRSMSRVAA